MQITIGINGFGRIGRLVFRIIENKRLNGENIKVVAINNRSIDINYIKYLIENDSVHGNPNYDININNNNLIVNNNKIHIFSESDPLNIDWGNVGAYYIVEATGAFRTMYKASFHLKSGAKKVIVTSPSSDIPMYVMGVNHNKYSNNQFIISNASCTTNCLAPLVKIIHDNYGIIEGLMTTVHSVTSSQNTVDNKSLNNWRLGRCASNNIIPSTTGAAKAVGIIIPELNGKLTGMAIRVPTINVSLIDLTVRLKNGSNLYNIIETIKKSSMNEMKGILSYTDQPLVSSDFIGNSHSCIVDINACIQLNDNFIKLVAWYDNEWSYSNRVVDLILHTL